MSNKTLFTFDDLQFKEENGENVASMIFKNGVIIKITSFKDDDSFHFHAYCAKYKKNVLDTEGNIGSKKYMNLLMQAAQYLDPKTLRLPSFSGYHMPVPFNSKKEFLRNMDSRYRKVYDKIVSDETARYTVDEVNMALCIHYNAGYAECLDGIWKTRNQNPDPEKFYSVNRYLSGKIDRDEFIANFERTFKDYKPDDFLEQLPIFPKPIRVADSKKLVEVLDAIAYSSNGDDESSFVKKRYVKNSPSAYAALDCLQTLSTSRAGCMAIKNFYKEKNIDLKEERADFYYNMIEFDMQCALSKMEYPFLTYKRHYEMLKRGHARTNQ